MFLPIYVFIYKCTTPSLLSIRDGEEETVFREVVSFSPDPLPGEETEALNTDSTFTPGALGQVSPRPLSCSFSVIVKVFRLIL